MTTDSQNKLFSDILRVAAVTAFFAGAAFFFDRSGLNQYLFHASAWQSIAGAYGNVFLSSLIFTAACGLLISLGVPRLLVSAAGGVIYGALIGTIASVAAALIGASLSYFFGRFTLSDIVARRFSGKFNEWRSRFRDNAFWWVLYGRLFPFSNSTVMSLFCGSCNVPFLPYILASFAGFVPLAATFSFYGSGGMQGNYLQIAIATVLLVVSIMARRIIDSLVSRYRLSHPEEVNPGKDLARDPGHSR